MQIINKNALTALRTYIVAVDKMTPNTEQQSKEELGNTIEDVQKQIDKLPEIGFFSLVIPAVVIIVFTALAVFAVGGMLNRQDLGGKDLMGQLLGLLFFIMPVAFSFKYMTKKLQIKRSRAMLLSIKARLEDKIKES